MVADNMFLILSWVIVYFVKPHERMKIVEIIFLPPYAKGILFFNFIPKQCTVAIICLILDHSLSPIK